MTSYRPDVAMEEFVSTNLINIKVLLYVGTSFHGLGKRYQFIDS